MMLFAPDALQKKKKVTSIEVSEFVFRIQLKGIFSIRLYGTFRII